MKNQDSPSNPYQIAAQQAVVWWKIQDHGASPNLQAQPVLQVLSMGRLIPVKYQNQNGTVHLAVRRLEASNQLIHLFVYHPQGQTSMLAYHLEWERMIPWRAD